MMNGNDQVLGIVNNDEFQRLVPPGELGGPTRLTSIPPQAAQSPESGELDLNDHEGSTVMVTDHDQREWGFSAALRENRKLRCNEQGRMDITRNGVNNPAGSSETHPQNKLFWQSATGKNVHHLDAGGETASQLAPGIGITARFKWTGNAFEKEADAIATRVVASVSAQK
jgi:hypothetical protein